MTYCEESHYLYCSICLALAKPLDSIVIVVKGGMRAWKHVHQRIAEHEGSKTHRGLLYFFRVNKADIGSLLAEKQISVHRDQVRKKRQVTKSVINVIKVISKHGLSYRGDKPRDESAYSLEDLTLDHGIFLELILLLSKYDACLQGHVSECIERSKKMHKS